MGAYFKIQVYAGYIKLAGYVRDRDSFRITVRSTGSPPLLGLHKKGRRHILIGWGGKRPTLLPLLNQESVSTTLRTGDLTPTAISPEGISENQSETKTDNKSQTTGLLQFVIIKNNTGHLMSAWNIKIMKTFDFKRSGVETQRMK